MYTLDEYNNLRSKYGFYSSWAIWDYQKESNTSIIDKHYALLNNNYILVGLNISATLSDNPWVNFHGGKHDRKLKYACNDTKLRGSYITDLFKDLPEPKSNRLKNQLNEEIIKKNVKFFNQEINDLKLNEKSLFIILGTPSSQLAKIFNQYFRQGYNNQVIYHFHYSFYGISDKMWVSGLWEKLNIHADYSNIVNKYK